MFCDNLKKLRLSHGMTQAQLADRLGVNPSTVGMYEQGRRTPDTTTLKKISCLFKTSVDNLLENTLISEPLDVEVSDIIDDITLILKSQKGLMFNGKPVNKKDREKIANAIKIAAAIAVSGTQLD